jgi:hypothetical protein
MFEMRRLSDTGVSYSLLLDFSLLAKDTTPSEAVEAMLDGYPDNPVVDYPFKDWNNYHMSLKEYLEWLLMLRHIAANLPPEVVEENRVAVEVY